MALRRPLLMAKIVWPSVLTMSGSSTPCSCTLVWEESLVDGVAGAGASVALPSPRVPPAPAVSSVWTKLGGLAGAVTGPFAFRISRGAWARAYLTRLVHEENGLGLSLSARARMLGLAAAAVSTVAAVMPPTSAAGAKRNTRLRLGGGGNRDGGGR